jgi:hypothetical protein
MPAPLMVNVGEVPGAFMIVNALAPGLNTMPLTSALNAMKGRVRLEDANVAVSAGPLGTVVGVQLVAVNQSPVAGLAFQVALPAKLLLAVESRSVKMAAAEGRKARARERRGEVCDGGIVRHRLMVELFIDCIVLVRIEVLFSFWFFRRVFFEPVLSAKAEIPIGIRHDWGFFLVPLRRAVLIPSIVLEFAASSSRYDDAPIHAARGYATAQ